MADALGTPFMISLIFLAYNVTNDWKKLQLDTPKEK